MYTDCTTVQLHRSKNSIAPAVGINIDSIGSRTLCFPSEEKIIDKSAVGGKVRKGKVVYTVRYLGRLESTMSRSA